MKKHDVIEEDHKITYHIYEQETDDGIKYTLIRSEHEEWSEDFRNTEVMSVLDDGNDVRFSYKIGKKLDYAELHELHIMIAFLRHDDTIKYPTKIIKPEILFTV